jgi:hypothetical protein
MQGEYTMKVLESSVLLVAGAILLTFAGLSYGLFPRPLTLGNPGLFMEALFLAGVVFAGLGVRGLYRIHCALSGIGSSPTRAAAA